MCTCQREMPKKVSKSSSGRNARPVSREPETYKEWLIKGIEHEDSGDRLSRKVQEVVRGRYKTQPVTTLGLQ